MVKNEIKPVEFAISCHKGNSCELYQLHQRARDIVRHWTNSMESYHEPEEFRTYLNSCIQELRNFTFVLQSNKKIFPDFKNWYMDWQNYFKNDEILRWVVDARNKIVKQGDLKTHSYARVSILDSYRKPKFADINIDPFILIDDTIEFLEKLDIKGADFGQGYIKITRRWVVDDLEGNELLNVLGYSFDKMVKLLIAAHNQLWIDSDKYSEKYLFEKSVKPEELKSLECRIPEMITFEDKSTLYVKISSGQVVNIEKSEIPKSEEVHKIAKDKYTNTFQRPSKHKEFTLKGGVESYLEIAKHILKIDKHLIPIVAIISDDGKATLNSLEFYDQSDKYMIWEAISQEVKRQNGIYVISVAESWLRMISDKSNKLIPLNKIEKKEVIQARGISKSGEDYSLIQFFHKEKGEIVFDQLSEEIQSFSSFLDRIKEVWKEQK